MKRTFEDNNSQMSNYSQEMVENIKRSINSKVQIKNFGTQLQKVNIYALQYLIETHKQPSELRKVLLRYTKLCFPYISDIAIEFNYLSKEKILLEIRENNEDEKDQEDNKQSSHGFTPKFEKKVNQSSEQKEISEEEYGKIILKMLEVLGISIEYRVKDIQDKYKLSIELVNGIYEMMKLKSKQFLIMIQKTYEDDEDTKHINLYDKYSKNVFQSIYDETIDKVYKEYKKFFLKYENKEDIDDSLSKIIDILEQILSLVQLPETGSTQNNSSQNTQRQQNLLSFKELNNLKQLKLLFSTNNEYFYETLKPITERQFFYWKESVKLNGDNPDKICLFHMTNLIELNEKYTDIIKHSICAFANSQGGTLFVGIDNKIIQVGSKDLREIVQHNCIEQLKKLATSVMPRVNFDIKLINVVDSFKYQVQHKNTFVISLIVKSRRPTEMFCLLRHQREKCYFIRNQGFNQRLKGSYEIKKLSEMRMNETETPNLQDYIQFNDHFNPKDYKPLKNNNFHIQGSPKQNKRTLIFEDEDFMTSLKNQGNIFSKEYKTNIKNNNFDSEINTIQNNISQKFEDEDEHKPRNKEDIRKFKQDYQNEKKNLFQQLKPFENYQEVKNIRQSTEYNGRVKFENYKRSHSKKKSEERIPLTRNDDRRSFFLKNDQIPELLQYKLVPKLSQVQQRGQFFYHPQINQLDNWKKLTLKEYLTQQNTVNFSEFLQSQQISSLLQEFEQLNPHNCFLIFKIDTKYKNIFKEAIFKLKKECFNHFEYIGYVNNFTILKLDRENFNNQLERLISPITIKYSYQNKVSQGFDFESFEIKNIYNVTEAMNILDYLYKYLGVEVNIKYIQGKFTLCFPKIQNFLYAYHIFIKIKKVLEQDQYSNKVYPLFNQNTTF